VLAETPQEVPLTTGGGVGYLVSPKNARQNARSRLMAHNRPSLRHRSKNAACRCSAFIRFDPSRFDVSSVRG
jgi:hypothetical protein